MAPTQLLFLSIIFLSVLPGADAVSTVRSVAVRSRRSVTIPCLYDRKYEKHVKYWCKGSQWSTCVPVVRTDSPTVRAETSITDDPTHHVFTVTITELKAEDHGFYFCAVEINGGVDEGTRLLLYVTAGADAVPTVRSVAVQSGRSVTIPCLYDRKYEKHVKYWCKGSQWSTCIPVLRTDSPTVRGETSITDDPTHHVFTVTMTKLKAEDSGVYWCAVEIDGGEDERTRLYLSVTAGDDAVSTVSDVGVQSGRSVTIPCLYDRKYEKHVKYWCKGYHRSTCIPVVRTDSPTVRGETSITDDPTHHVFTVTMTELKTEDTGHYYCAVEIDGGEDERTPLRLYVIADAPWLWVDQQEVTGVEGGHVSVRCHYDESLRMKGWCRAEGSCVGVDSAKSGRAEIKDDRSENVFMVTMRKLNREDAGWYWCAAGSGQIPVHITVTQKTTTITVTTIGTSSLLTDAITSCLEHGSHQCSSAPTSLERTLGALSHTGVALVFLICSAVAFWKIWQYRRAQHSRNNREDVVHYKNNTDIVTLMSSSPESFQPQL